MRRRPSPLIPPPDERGTGGSLRALCRLRAPTSDTDAMRMRLLCFLCVWCDEVPVARYLCASHMQACTEDHGHDHAHGHAHTHSHKPNEETRAAERFGIRSFVYSRRRPFHPQRYAAAARRSQC